MDVILQAIAALPREQQTEWREIHGTDDSAPLSLDWRTLPRWTPEHREAVAIALHDWCLLHSDARDPLRSITESSRRVGVWLECAVARTTLSRALVGEDRARIAIETAERWVRGAADAVVCQIASHASSDSAYFGTPRRVNCSFAAAAAASVVYGATDSAAVWGITHDMTAADLCGVIAREVRTALDEAAKGYEKEVSK